MNLKMCYDVNFDKARAKELIDKVDVNEEFIDSEYGFKETLLSLAAGYPNMPFVNFLLECGADPNFIYDNGTHNVLWALQYAENDDEENDIRLRIVELLLQHGANPHIKVENEELYIYAVQMQIELACDKSISWNYRERFIDLLEKYGA